MLNYTKMAVGIALATLLVACSKPTVEYSPVVRPVKLMQLNLSSITKDHLPGEVTASRRAVLGFRVSGEILVLHINSGQKVTKGTLLAELEPTEFEIALKSATAHYDLAKVNFERAQLMIKDHLISQTIYDEGETEFKSADAELKRAQSNLSYTKLYAPYDGVVSATYLYDFEYAQAQQPVLSFLAKENIDIEIAAPERLIPVLKKMYQGEAKSNVLVSFPVEPSKSYPAEFKDISPVADQATGSYKVRLTMAQLQDVNLFPGMAANVEITSSNENRINGTTIPESAKMFENGNAFVWRLNKSFKVEKQQVVLDHSGKLISGLNDGDIIVLAGVSDLKQGQQVKEWRKERGL